MGKIPQPLYNNYKPHNIDVIAKFTKLIYTNKLTTINEISLSPLSDAIELNHIIENSTLDELESIYIDLYFLQYEIYKDFYQFISPLQL